jgi:hypothetical protein
MDDSAKRFRSIGTIRAERKPTLEERFGGFSIGSDFIGWVVATFFTIVFAGIVAAIIGSAGYQLGGSLSGTSGASQTLGLAGLLGGLVAVFLGYLIGGYTAGRMARFDGVKNGIGVVLWTIVIGIVLGIAGGVFGGQFGLADRFRLDADPRTLTIAGIVSLAVSLVVMLLGAILGAVLGTRYHRKIDRASRVI